MRKAVARLVSQDRKKRMLVTVMTAILVVGAIGVAMTNIDDAYLASKVNLVTYVPDRVSAGGQSTILVMTTDGSGKPVPNQKVDVTLEEGNISRVLWSGRTGSDGTAAPAIEFPVATGRVNLTVTSGSEVVETTTVLDDSIRIIITTDKPVYKPGDIIHMRFLSYAGVKPLPQESDLLAEVIDPNGDKIFKKLLQSDEHGISSYDLWLSDQLNQGTYTIKATVGNKTVTKALAVKDYVLPKFRVDVLGLDDWYSAQSYIAGSISSKYFFGEIVQGTVEVEASVYLGVWETYYTGSGTLADGEWTFNIPPVNYAVGLIEVGGNGYIQLNVTVTDTSGHEEQRYRVLPVAPSGVVLSVLTDSCLEGELSTFYAIVRTPQGRAVENASVTVRLYEDDLYRSTVGPFLTDSRGIARVGFVYGGETYALFKATSGSYDAEVLIDLEASSGLKVLADKDSYDVGDEGVFEIVYSGDSMTRNVYWDLVSRGYVVDRGVAQLEGGRATVEAVMGPETEPFAQLRVYKIEKDMGVIRDAVTFSVGGSSAMTVEVSTDGSSYYPRDAVGLSFYVESGGVPAVAALGVSVVDEAVYEVGSLFQGYEELLFGMDEEFVVPQYQVITYVHTGVGSLPSESTETFDEMEEGRVVSTWLSNVADAQALKEDATRGYWFALYFCAFVGLMVLAGARVRVRRGAMVSVVVALAIVLSVGFGAVYVMTLGFGANTGERILIPRSDDDSFNREAIAPAGLDGGFDFDTAYGEDTGTEGTSSQSTRPTIVRQYFPETWYWNPCLLTDETGRAEISLTAPDSITSWQVDVIASTSDGQVGTGSGSVKVFQPFFVEPDIPLSAVRGDGFPLSIMVYNYLETDQTVTVELSDEPWFTLGSPTAQVITVPAKYVSSVSFDIVADKVGWHTVSVQAYSDDAADAVVRAIEVVPDGKRTETVINGDIGNGQVTRTLYLEPDMIEGSANAWVKIQAGVEAVLLEGVADYIQHVSGCGEQSLSMLSIDILAYDTVMKLGSSPERMFAYENIVNQGIQHELMYLVGANNGIGRGIVWFPGDQDVHPWLTSWGLIAFQDAVNAGFGLDQGIIEDMQDWLLSIQDEDGSWEFPDWGIYEFNNPVLQAKEVAATGYIARALLHSGVPGSDPHIQAAVDYVEQHLDSVQDDPFSLSLSLLLLQAGGGMTSMRAAIADTLEELKTVDGDSCYWGSGVNLISDPGYDMWVPSTRTIETTGYAAMALDGEPGHEGSVDGAVKYLLDNRGALGGWMSTQDTVVAFHTLASVASGNTVEDVTVEVKVEGSPIWTMEMGEFNKDVTYLVDLRPYLANVTNVTVNCTGEGSVLYSMYLEQYVPWPDEAASSPFLTLTVTYDTTSISVTDRLNAHLYMLYNGSAPMIKMILLDLRAPLGFAFDLTEFDALDEQGVISSYDSNYRQVVVYITDILSGVPVEFDYSLVAQMPITSTLQGVVAWDMYDPEDLRSETLPVVFEAH